MIETRRVRGPWGLIGAVVAVAILESAVARHELELARPEGTNWRLALRAADRDTRGCATLCFGTSMVQDAVLPRVLEQRTGRPAYNLSVCAGRIPFSYYHLKRALAAGARPSAVVLDVHPAFTSASFRESESAWRDVLGYADCLDLAWSLRDPGIYFRTAAKKVLPSLGHRLALRSAVRACLRGEDPSQWGPNAQFVRNFRRNKGALVGVRNPDFGGAVSAIYRAIWLDNPARPVCDPVDAEYLHRLLRLADTHGVRVYWLILPVVPELQRGLEESGRDTLYNRLVWRYLHDHPNLTVLDARHSGYIDPKAYLDACHLAPAGAYALSRDLGDFLARDATPRPGAPRLVHLPAYRERPIDVPLEDLLQSYMALRGGTPTRR